MEQRKLEEISAQNTTLLERIIDILQPKKIELMIFPIKNINDLASTESLLLNKPEAEIEAYLKQKFSKRPLSKILDEVIAESLLLKVNWDGAKKKVALKNYALFNKFLYEALMMITHTLILRQRSKRRFSNVRLSSTGTLII
ncbi:uncharacterized protein LOC120773509 [Bactrocera tryoni]|uniref:uncharacterized protein LOC120773509 n=1 Tax=Bactrocera tryoni TaxID=59916 RepID=UPI001A9860D8|nr:uncharacterized protein LOC120773509 [Bactrocera tryoni]